ncbi:MAG: glycosyltransferase family 39 protein [Bacteroidia bacterium]|nr:glycosyltransferase family 39 protein [Bacteroidia bacterium]
MYQRLAIFLFSYVGLLLFMSFQDYGADVDSWYLVQNTDRMLERGTYFASRSPGFPLYELILCFLIPLGSFFASNLFSLFAALVLALCFFLQLRKEGIPQAEIAVYSLLTLPLYIIGASSTIDYLPALSLQWISFFLLYTACEKDGNPHGLYLSAFVLGMAAGFRLTALSFIPASILFLFLKQRSFREIGAFGLTSLLAAFVAFLPVFLGPGFELPLDKSVLSLSYRIQVATYHGISFLGVLPLLLLLIGSFLFLWDLRKRNYQFHFRLSASEGFHASVLLIYALLFLLLPDESSYLLPLYPSLLYLIHKYFRPQLLPYFLAMIILSNLFIVELKGGESGQRSLKPYFKKGYSWQNLDKREHMQRMKKAVNRFLPEQKTLLMIEIPWVNTRDPNWTYDAEARHFKKEGSNFYFGPYIFDREDLRKKKNAGYRICVWREQKWEYYVMDLDDMIGREIEVVELDELLGDDV